MAKFRQVQTNFWSNPYIQEEMTAEDKYFYLYLMTNEFTTQIGIYPITKKQIAFDLGYSIESIQALLQRFESYHKLIKYDNETREIILLKWAENNLNGGGKPVQDLVKKEIEQVKNKEFLKLMFLACPENELKKFIKTLLNFEEKDIDNKEIYEASYGALHDTGTINNKEEIINNNKKEKNIKKEKSQTEVLTEYVDTLDLDIEKKEIFKKWILYKKDNKQYKNTMSIDTLIKKWGYYSIVELTEIIENSIANGYQGLFELKNKNISIQKKEELKTNRVIENNFSDFDFMKGD